MDCHKYSILSDPSDSHGWEEGEQRWSPTILENIPSKCELPIYIFVAVFFVDPYLFCICVTWVSAYEKGGTLFLVQMHAHTVTCGGTLTAQSHAIRDSLVETDIWIKEKRGAYFYIHAMKWQNHHHRGQ
jgi:hypothetical protein